MSFDWRPILSILLASSLIAYWEQRLADSGELVFTKIALTIVISFLSYITVFLIVLKRDNALSWLRQVLLAVGGTILNLLLLTAYQSYTDYLFRQSIAEPGVLREFGSDLILRLLILLPLNSVMFFILFTCLSFLINRTAKALNRLGLLNFR